MAPTQTHIQTPSQIHSTATNLSITIRASSLSPLSPDIQCSDAAFRELGPAVTKVLHALQQDNTGRIYVLSPQPYQAVLWQPGADLELRFGIIRVDRNNLLRYSALDLSVVRDTAGLCRTEREVDEDIKHRIVGEYVYGGVPLTVGTLQWLFAQTALYKQRQMESIRPRSQSRRSKWCCM